MTHPLSGPGSAASSSPDAHAQPSHSRLDVPVTVWPGLPVTNRCAGPLTYAVAERVIATFSRPGDLVAAVDGSALVIETAAAAGRRVGFILAADGPDAGKAALAVTTVCTWSSKPDGGDPEPSLLYAACERVLRPSGVLAVITRVRAPDAEIVGEAGLVVAHARAAGLSYAQHIVLIHAAISGDQLVPYPCAATSPGGSRVHFDLLVFTKPGGAACHD